MKEVGRGGLQEKIVNSIAKQGGIAKYLNGVFSKGIPDLLIAMPNYPLMLAEIKHLGERKGAIHSVPLKPIQRVVIQSLNNRQPNNAIILTGIELPDALHLFKTLDPYVKIIVGKTPSVKYVKGTGFDMQTLIWGSL